MPTSTDPLAAGANLEAATRGRIKQNDPWVTEAIAAASEAVRNACGWHIAPSVTETLTRDARGSTVLALPTMHLTDVDSLVENGTALAVDVDFEWSENGVLERFAGWVWKRRGIAATITHGYATTPPVVLDLVCAIAARGIIAQRTAGVKREQAGTNSLELATLNEVPISVDILPHELARLRPYVLPERA